MSKYIKIVKNNWKKTLFGTVAVIYGTNYAYEKYQTKQLMRALCEEAAKYGELPVPPTLKPRSVTVILNPAANRRKAKANFEKYCAPLLHLAGYSVDVVMTESEGQARTLAADLKESDIIVVAGGDGTLSETVTGLMRSHGAVSAPLGVLPLGRTNSVALALLGRGGTGGEAADMAGATMAVVRGQTKRIDVLRVDVVEETDDSSPPKPVYGLSGIKWGAYRDALSRQDKYWYFGVLRGYAAVLFNSLGSDRQPVSAHVTFTHACDGCNRCYQTRSDLQQVAQSRRWFHYLVPSFTKKTPEAPQINYKQVTNPQCGVVSELDLVGLDVNVTCPCVCGTSKGLQVSLGPASLGWWEWVGEGWRRVSGELPTTSPVVDAQHLEIKPVVPDPEEDTEERWFSIDNEEYEVRPIKVTLIPNSVQVFFNNPVHTSLLNRIVYSMKADLNQILKNLAKS